MSQPLVTIITPTYNRPALFAECAQSVLAQTFTDWVWWAAFNLETWNYSYDLNMIGIPLWSDPRFVPIWYAVPESARLSSHIPAQIVNWLYPKVTTPYIYFLADDDLIDPEGLSKLLDVASDEDYDTRNWNPSYRDGKPIEAIYGRCEVQDQQPDGTYKTTCWCYEHGDVGLGTGIDPHCRLDGGQVLHTKALWDRATADGWTLTDAKADAAANDGTLLSRLAQFARFHYVPQRIVTHRRTFQSTFHKPQPQPQPQP